MSLFPDISVRRLQPELMDDPSLDAAEHARALGGLRLVNIASFTARTLWTPIQHLAAVPGHPPVRVLDIATGSGDVPLALNRLARRDGAPVSVDGCDLSARAIAIAKQRAAAAGAPSGFFTFDAIRDPIPGDYDVVTCGLFMHHLAEQDVVDLLYKMRTAARRMVLVSDLRRTAVGLGLAYLTTRLSRSRVVRTDALLSVRAAFTMSEFASLAHRAGLDGATISPAWPQRFLLTWRRA